MNMNEFTRLVRRAFGAGITGKEEFQMELEAAVNPAARAVLEQAERDDARLQELRDLVLASRYGAEASIAGRSGAALVAEAATGSWFQSRFAAMAASVLVAVSATWFATYSLYVPGGSTAIASSSIFYLEPTRGDDLDTLPAITVADENDWVTLVTYPTYEELQEFRVDLDRMVESGADAADLQSASWDRVWESYSIGAGADAIAVVINRDLLHPGVYRLNVNGVTTMPDSSRTGSISHFRVTD